MENIQKQITDLDSRMRVLEQDNSKITTTLDHFTKSVDNFINRLDKHEEREEQRFIKFEDEISKLYRIAYIGIGGLAIVQFLIANGIIKVG